MSSERFINSNFKFQPARLEQARLSQGLNKTELAKKLGISQQMVSKYEAGISNPTDTVFNDILEKLGFPAGFFFMPPEYKNADKTIFYRKQSSATLKQRDSRSVRNYWVEHIIKYLEKLKIKFPDNNLPKVDKKPKGVAWQKEEIEQLAMNVRKYWGLGLGPISNIILLLEKNGIIVCRQQAASYTIDGYSFLDEYPIVFLITNGRSSARLRFSAVHELGHLLMHAGVYTNDDLMFNSIHNQLESEANQFASAFLLPIESFGQEVYSSSLSHLKMLKRRWLVSIQAMITRCGDLELFTEHQVLNLRKQISKYKIRIEEPLDDEIPQEEPVVLKQAMELIMSHNVKSASDILNDLNYPSNEIEDLCNLERGRLSRKDNIIFVNFKS